MDRIPTYSYTIMFAWYFGHGVSFRPRVFRVLDILDDSETVTPSIRGFFENCGFDSRVEKQEALGCMWLVFSTVEYTVHRTQIK